MLGKITLWNSDLRQVNSCKPTSRSCSLCVSSAGFLTCFTWNFAFPLPFATVACGVFPVR